MTRKKISRFLAIGLCGAVLAGCSTNEDNVADTSATESEETQSSSSISSEESSSAASEVTSSSESEKSTEASKDPEEVTNSQEQEASELTEEEAKDTLVDYIKENDPEIGELIDTYDIVMEEEGSSFQASIFPPVTSDDTKGAALIARYKIDRKTGNVEKVTDETDETEPYISEIVDFSEEERRAHHEKLADGPVQDKVYEHLMLPGIHENTKKYEGRINPGESVRFSYFDEEGSQQSMYDPEVSEDGYFTIDLTPYDFKAGQEIEVAITGGYPQQQNFILTVNEAKEGMEDIRVRE